MNLLIVTIFVLLRPIYTQYSRCVNPQGFSGQCVPLQLCDYLLNVAKYAQQSLEARTFLSRSQCGYNGYTPYVCCPQMTQRQPQPNQVPMNRNIMAASLMKSLLPTPPNCGIDIEDRIIGGSVTTISEFPWFALLKYSKPGSSVPVFSCSGSLINERYVITAAHCVHTQILQRTKLVGVRLGEWNLLTNPDCDESQINEKVCNEPHVDVGVEELIIHEKYLPQSYNQYHDIALIRMTQKLTYNEFIKPICMQISNATTSLVGLPSVVAGFGRTESAHTSNIKLKVTLDIVENAKCNQVFRPEGRRLNETQLCAGGKKNVDSCRGDSGGPMMRQVTQGRVPYWILIGITSYGANPCGQENIPGVYTRIDSFLPWIESKLRL